MSRTVFTNLNITYISLNVKLFFVSILYMTSLLLSYFVHNAQNQSANISAFHDCTFTMKRRSTCDKFIALKLLEKLYNIAILFSLVCHKQKKEKALSRACHFFRSGACTLDLGFFVCCIFLQEEKGYSSPLSKWLSFKTSRNSSISSFELGFILFTT